MTLETTALIWVLTLLTVSLGSDFYRLTVISPELFKADDETYLIIASNIYKKSLRLMSIIFCLTLAGSIVLNVTDQSRSEPYLLGIGLVSLIVYGLVMGAVAFLVNNKIMTLKDHLKAMKNARDLQRRLSWILWIVFLLILVSYWSFLHYALNPRV